MLQSHGCKWVFFGQKLKIFYYLHRQDPLKFFIFFVKNMYLTQTWVGLTVYKNKFYNFIRTSKFKFSFEGLKLVIDMHNTYLEITNCTQIKDKILQTCPTHLT